MILYKGRMFSNQKALEFASKIESCYDVGTLMFESEDSLTCFVSYEGEPCSEYFTCSSEEEKEEMMDFAREHRVSISWL